MTKLIFISYSKKDNKFAIKLANDLEKAGHNIWIDRSIKVGEAWKQAIEEKLEEAEEVIVILSRNSIVSRWVQHEGSVAYGLKKKMYPVLIEDIPPDDVPIWVEQLQYHSFVGIDYDIAYKSLNSVLTPPSPYQTILDAQVAAYRQTGALMSEGLVNVITEARSSLIVSPEAEKLISISQNEIDIAEKRLESAREEVVAAKQLATLGTAIAALQHRISNTLNIIVPNITRLRSRIDPNDPTIAEILDIIERNARYTAEIIYRIQEPLREVEIQNININAIISSVALNLEQIWDSETSRRPVFVKLELDESIPIIRGPSGQIAEVFTNLIQNSKKAMDNGGNIVVTTGVEREFVTVRVVDTGSGIPESIQKRLFDKPVPPKEPSSGAGIGLWLSRIMLHTLGGNVEIDETNSSGTTMLVTLPIS